MTRESDFFKSLFLKRISGQTNKDWFSFYVPVGCEKWTSQVKFYSDAPIVAYQKHDQHSFFPSSLDSSLKASNEFAAANTIEIRISSSLKREILARIELAIEIMTYGARKRLIFDIYIINCNNGRKLLLLILWILPMSV